MDEKFGILFWISLKFVPKCPIDNKSVLVQVFGLAPNSHYLNQLANPVHIYAAIGVDELKWVFGDWFKNAYKLLNFRAFKFSHPNFAFFKKYYIQYRRKSTCLTGIFTCLRLSGSGLCWALILFYYKLIQLACDISISCIIYRCGTAYKKHTVECRYNVVQDSMIFHVSLQ